MKKLSYILIALLLTILTACSSTTSKDGAEKKEKEQTVELTLPADLLQGQDLDSMITEAKTAGVTEATKNEDGSLTYKMTQATQEKLMKDFETTILDSMKETTTSGEYPTIKEITHNDSFTEFTFVVDQEAFEQSYDAFASIPYTVAGTMYQLYSGTNYEDIKVTLLYKDQATKEVFNEVNYPKE